MSPGCDLGRVHRRAPAGDDATTQQAGPVERPFLVDLDAAGLVGDGVMGEGAEPADGQMQVLAPGVVTAGAVRQLHARRGGSAEVAQVRMARGTARALAAGRQEGEHDVVADLERADARADLHHDAGTLVAADARRLAGDAGEIAGHHMLVAVAHAAGSQLDQHFAGLRRIEVDLFDAPRRVSFPQNRGFGLHSRNPQCHTCVPPTIAAPCVATTSVGRR